MDSSTFSAFEVEWCRFDFEQLSMGMGRGWGGPERNSAGS